MRKARGKLSPLSTYNAPGALRQDPPRGRQSPLPPTSKRTGADCVTSLTHQAFALPDHLAAKADPVLIAADEEHFARIAQSLEETIADLTDRLQAERKHPGGAGQEAMDRDNEVHRLTARLRALRRFTLDLCLGRIVDEGADEPTHISRVPRT